MRNARIPLRFFALLALAILPSATRAHAQARQAGSADPRAGVLERLRAQPVGGVTMREFCPPDVFLGRVADRIIRMDYQERFRTVLAQAEPSKPAEHAQPDRPRTRPTPTNTKRGLYTATILSLLVITFVIRRRRRKAAP